MDIYYKQIILCVLITLVSRSYGQNDPFTVKPVNTYGILNRNVTLQCDVGSTTETIFWDRPDGLPVADSGAGVYPEFNGEYTMTNQGNTWTLTVLNAAADDAGRYDCSYPRSNAFAYAEIIWLDSDQLDCTESSETTGDYGDTLEGEWIRLECQIGYRGLWAPIQDWMWSDQQIINPNNFSSETLVSYSNQYTSDRLNNNKHWVVTVRFPEPYEGLIPSDTDTPPYQYYSRATPTFEYTYYSTVLIVIYGPDTMSLDPIQEEYNPGDTITCAAEGNPEPELKWVDQANVTIAESGTLLIEPGMEGRQTFSCMATNEVRGQTMTAMAEITFNVTILIVATTTGGQETGECCFLEQWEGNVLLYFGFVTPETEPTANDGIIRIASDYINQKMYTHYVDLEHPPEPDLETIIGDYVPTPKKFYNIYKDGTCYIDEYFVPMTPRCISDIFPKLMDFTLAMDIPAAMYGDVANYNFVTVRSTDCLPMVNLATRPNIPTPGTFRFETSQYANITEGISDPNIFNPPADCVPRPVATNEVPDGSRKIAPSVFNLFGYN